MKHNSKGNPGFFRIGFIFAIWLFSSQTLFAKDRIQIDSFEYRGPDAEKWIADGFRDTVTVQLGQISSIEAITTEDQHRALQLIAERRKAGEEIDIQKEVARILEADFICRGSIINGSEIQVNLQLLKGPDFRVYRTAMVPVKKEEIPRGWDIAVVRLLGEINAEVPESERQHISIPPTERREAYEAYSRGLALLRINPGQALLFFTRALQLDPQFSDAALRAAQVNETLGNYDEAIRLFNQRMMLLEKANQKNSPAYGAALSGLGGVCDSRGEYRLAVSYYKQDIAILEASGRTETSAYAGTLNNLAVSYRNLGDTASAMENYRKALAVRERIDQTKTPGYAAGLQGIGSVYFTTGDLDRALDYSTKAARLLKEDLRLDGTSLYASTLHGIATILTGQRKYDEALPFFIKANEIRKTLGLDSTDEFSNTLAGIGRIYYAKSRFDEALRQFAQAKAIKERLRLENTPGYASVLGGIGGIYLKQEKVQEALALFEQAGGIYQKLGLDGVLEYADILSSIAIIYYEKLNNPCRAKTEMGRVLVIYRRLERPDIGPRHQFFDRLTGECRAP